MPATTKTSNGVDTLLNIAKVTTTMMRFEIIVQRYSNLFPIRLLKFFGYFIPLDRLCFRFI